MTEKVLLVDDEVNLLRGLRRQLRKRFDISIAEGGQQALEAIKNEGPYAVVISDMQMPGMNGIETLTAIKDASPDTVRMMLTGNADQGTAVEAINGGNIFRFFNKPCPAEMLAEGIEAGLHQYGLITAEKDILEKTLGGSMKVLMDVLSMVDPEIFGVSSKLRNWAQKVSKNLGINPPWKLGIAATLAPIGQIAVPKELRDKALSGENLTPEEYEIVSKVPENGQRLIRNIPRLKPVADIVYYQGKCFDGSGFPADGVSGEDIPRESRILKILIDLASLSKGVKPTAADFDALEKRNNLYDLKLLQQLKGILSVVGLPADQGADQSKESHPQSEGASSENETAAAVKQESKKSVVEDESVNENLLPIKKLQSGHILKSNIEYEDGRLILAAGMKLTAPQIELLKNQRAMNLITGSVEVESIEPELEE